MCGETNNLHWSDSTPTGDTWDCKECEWTWVIEVESVEQADTELTERAEING